MSFRMELRIQEEQEARIFKPGYLRERAAHIGKPRESRGVPSGVYLPSVMWVVSLLMATPSVRDACGPARAPITLVTPQTIPPQGILLSGWACSCGSYDRRMNFKKPSRNFEEQDVLLTGSTGYRTCARATQQGHG